MTGELGGAHALDVDHGPGRPLTILRRVLDEGISGCRMEEWTDTATSTMMIGIDYAATMTGNERNEDV